MSIIRRDKVRRNRRCKRGCMRGVLRWLRKLRLKLSIKTTKGSKLIRARRWLGQSCFRIDKILEKGSCLRWQNSNSLGKTLESWVQESHRWRWNRRCQWSQCTFNLVHQECHSHDTSEGHLQLTIALYVGLQEILTHPQSSGTQTSLLMKLMWNNWREKKSSF